MTPLEKLETEAVVLFWLVTMFLAFVAGASLEERYVTTHEPPSQTAKE